MTRRPPPKSRTARDTIRITIDPHTDRRSNRDDEPPGYSGHNGGSFDDANYRPGRGVFGFRQDT